MDPVLQFGNIRAHGRSEQRHKFVARVHRKGIPWLHYLTYYQKPFYGWHRYRSDPEFRAIYAGLAQKVADLRARL